MEIAVTLLVGFACCFLSVNQFTNCIPWIVMCGLAMRSMEKTENRYVWICAMAAGAAVAVLACWILEGPIYYGLVAAVECGFFMYLAKKK